MYDNMLCFIWFKIQVAQVGDVKTEAEKIKTSEKIDRVIT